MSHDGTDFLVSKINGLGSVLQELLIERFLFLLPGIEGEARRAAPARPLGQVLCNVSPRTSVAGVEP
jgi:hypothetical protein